MRIDEAESATHRRVSNSWPKVAYDPVKRPPFDPKRAKGSLFEGSLFDPTPAAPPSARQEANASNVEGSVELSTKEPRAVIDRSQDVARAAGPARSERPESPAASPRVVTGSSSSAVPAAVASRVHELSVSAFNELVARTLEDSMRGQFRVVGELANLSRKGHWYFSIKDARSVLPCVMWQSDAARVAFTPKDGDAVVVTGKIGHYTPHGKTQLYAVKIEPQGIGALELEFQRLVKDLREKGYFADERKKPLPPNPRRVAVITSASGAALQDVLKTARERRAGVEFLVIDVRVQGEGAATEVARALRAVDRFSAERAIDAVIVTRGGGSREDLWAFNDRAVADAAFALRVPLVAAIGHEIDTSIIELVADRRASTPTQAVMHLLPDTAALVERVDRAARDLRNAMRWALQSRREAVARFERAHQQVSPALRIAQTRARLDRTSVALRTVILDRVRLQRRMLDALGARLAQQAPSARAAAARTAIDALGPRLERAMRARLGVERSELLNLERRLRSAGPEETLARGYSIVTTASGGLVRSTGDAQEGDRLSILVADGTLGVRVEPSRDMRTERARVLEDELVPEEVTLRQQKNVRRKKSPGTSAGFGESAQES